MKYFNKIVQVVNLVVLIWIGWELHQLVYEIGHIDMSCDTSSISRSITELDRTVSRIR